MDVMTTGKLGSFLFTHAMPTLSLEWLPFYREYLTRNNSAFIVQSLGSHASEAGQALLLLLLLSCHSKACMLVSCTTDERVSLGSTDQTLIKSAPHKAIENRGQRLINNICVVQMTFPLDPSDLAVADAPPLSPLGSPSLM